MLNKSIVIKNLKRMIKSQRGDRSQASYAEDLQVSQSQVHNWENGTSLPRLEQIESLAQDAGVLPEQYVARLYGREIDPHAIVERHPDPLDELLESPENDRIEAIQKLAASLNKNRSQ
jgi:transcriptional regulator with XRE-family HTH domain